MTHLNESSLRPGYGQVSSPRPHCTQSKILPAWSGSETQKLLDQSIFSQGAAIRGVVWAWWMNGENRFNGPIKRFLECRFEICHLRNMIRTLILNFPGQEEIFKSHEYSWKHDNRSFVSIRVLNCYMNIAFIWSWQNFVCENCKVQYRLAKTLS